MYILHGYELFKGSLIGNWHKSITTLHLCDLNCEGCQKHPFQWSYYSMRNFPVHQVLNDTTISRFNDDRSTAFHLYPWLAFRGCSQIMSAAEGVFGKLLTLADKGGRGGLANADITEKGPKIGQKYRCLLNSYFHINIFCKILYFL